MNNSLIEKVNQAIDIVELASEFVQLEKKGKNLMGLCPFHDEKTPSFSVSSEKNIAYCMSCKKGGAPITFYQQIKNITFQEALYEMAKRAGLENELKQPVKSKYTKVYEMFNEAAKFYQYNLLNSASGKPVLEYLNQRQIEYDSIRHFEIGLSPNYGDTLYQMLKDKGFETSEMIKYGLVKQKDDGTYYDLFSNRLMFPIKNELDNVVAFSGRTLNKGDNVKYVNSPESPVFIKGQTIYHLSDVRKTINKNNPVIIAEGFFDVIKIYQSGFKNVVATMGTALTKKHIELLKDLSQEMILSFDGDNAGLTASFQASKQILRSGIIPKVIIFPEKLDPDDYISNYGDNAFLELVETKSVNAYDFMYYHIKSQYNLTSVIDKPKFKNEMTKTINSFDNSVKQHYLVRLAKDLNIDINDIKVNKSEPKDTLTPNEKNTITELKNRYENAEIELLYCMIMDRDLAYYIDERLEPTDYVNLIVPLIRKKIINFYHKNNRFDFLSEDLELSEEERSFISVNVYGNLHFQNNIKPQKNDTIMLMKIVKDAYLIRKLEQNMVDLKRSNGDLQEVLKLRVERLELIKQVKRIGGS